LQRIDEVNAAPDSTVFKGNVWNHNTQTETILGFGIKEALIETSLDGNSWTELKTVELPQATGSADETGVDVALDDVVAKYVRITALSNVSVLGLAGRIGSAIPKFLMLLDLHQPLGPEQIANTPCQSLPSRYTRSLQLVSKPWRKNAYRPRANQYHGR